MNHFCWKIRFFGRSPTLVDTNRNAEWYMGDTVIGSGFQGNESPGWVLGLCLAAVVRCVGAGGAQVQMRWSE